MIIMSSLPQDGGGGALAMSTAKTEETTALLADVPSQVPSQQLQQLGVEALNWTTCFMLNATELDKINATEECAALMGPPLPVALMTVIQVREGLNNS